MVISKKKIPLLFHFKETLFAFLVEARLRDPGSTDTIEICLVGFLTSSSTFRLYLGRVHQ